MKYDLGTFNWDFITHFMKILDNSKAFSTLILICAVLLVRGLIILWLEKHTDLEQHQVVRWRHRIRYVALGFVIVAILIIWAPQLRTLALSAIAVIAAIVVVLKETVTCLTGTLIRASVEGARIGGRIIIDDVHGDVTATDILSTTVLEVNENGQRTGKTITLPNSLFLTKPATTESSEERRFTLLMVSIPLKRDDDWQATEALLLAKGKAISESYLKDAKKHFGRFGRKYGFNAPGPEPKVLIDWDRPDEISLHLRLAVPFSEQNAMRQDILRTVLLGKI